MLSSRWTLPMKRCRCAKVCSACPHDRLRTEEMLLLGLVLMAERQGWESCEKPNPLWWSQLLPDGDLHITCARMPSAKNVRRLHSVSAQQTSECLIQEGTASYAAMAGGFFFFLYWEEKWKPEQLFNSAWKWKKKWRRVYMRGKLLSHPSCPQKLQTLTPDYLNCSFWARSAVSSKYPILLFPSLPKPSCCCCSVAKSCSTLGDPKDCSMPGFSFLIIFQFARVHVQWTADAIQPSHPLSPSPPFALSLSQHQGLFCFTSGGQSIGASPSAAVLPKSTQGWYPWRLTDLIALLSKGLSIVFSRTTVQKHQFFSALPSLLSNSHIHTWLLERP